VKCLQAIAIHTREAQRRFFDFFAPHASQVVEIAERFFFGLNARIEMVPVMAAEDLQKVSGVQGIIQRYG
jgi:hypothetical protein